MTRSKIGCHNDSVLLDHDWIHRLSAFFPVLKQGDQSAPLWSFDWSSFLKVFHKVICLLQIDLVPYQWRHSGASIDRALDLRPQDEVQKRGRWKTQKSMTRYERGARLSHTYSQYRADLKVMVDQCEPLFVAVLLGETLPAAVVLRKVVSEKQCQSDNGI